MALESRVGRDGRVFGELFYEICDELPDIEFAEAFLLLMKVFLDVAAEKLFLSEEELESLFTYFILSLPETLKKKLLNGTPCAKK